jgi:mannose-1-phosphate guanylyltransferase/phosphomannomutase
MSIALIMAGGRSLRMRASSGRRHKALVEVLGLSMLERNILALLSHGFHDIIVAISAREKSLIALAGGRAARLARAGGATLRVYLERRPLGTIGAARAIRAGAQNLLVVNVDNLTALDLTAFLAHHCTSKAAMTIATHTEPFPIPFGQVSVRRGRVMEYKEKPVLQILLSSGCYVLSPAARRRIPAGRSVGAPELVQILLRQKERLSAFTHSSPWIDVNDAASVDKAEALIMANFRCFELFRQPPHSEIVFLGVLKNGRIALSKSSHRAAEGVRLPVEQVNSEMESPIDAAFRLGEQMGLPVTKPQLVTSFDEQNSRTRERMRWHLFACELEAQPRGTNPVSKSGVRWLNVNQLSKFHSNSRTIAYLNRYIAAQNSYSVRI